MKLCQITRGPLYIMSALVAFGIALATERVIALAHTQYTGTWSRDE